MGMDNWVGVALVVGLRSYVHTEHGTTLSLKHCSKCVLKSWQFADHDRALSYLDQWTQMPICTGVLSVALHKLVFFGFKGLSLLFYSYIPFETAPIPPPPCSDKHCHHYFSWPLWYFEFFFLPLTILLLVQIKWITRFTPCFFWMLA